MGSSERSLRKRLPELALEAVMVVFAVLVASSVLWRTPTLEEINSIYGRHVILVQVHAEMEALLEALLEDEGTPAS